MITHLSHHHRSGLQAGKDHSISITFHVMIQKSYWEWDSMSQVCIRFGHEHLGNWNDSTCDDFTLET